MKPRTEGTVNVWVGLAPDKQQQRSGYDIFVWKPEYAGWAWVGFTDGIPAVGAAYVLLMREDEIFWGRRELYYEGKCWKAGEPKPSEAPEIGTRFRWRDA